MLPRAVRYSRKPPWGLHPTEPSPRRSRLGRRRTHPIRDFTSAPRCGVRAAPSTPAATSRARPTRRGSVPRRRRLPPWSWPASAASRRLPWPAAASNCAPPAADAGRRSASSPPTPPRCSCAAPTGSGDGSRWATCCRRPSGRTTSHEPIGGLRGRHGVAPVEAKMRVVRGSWCAPPA